MESLRAFEGASGSQVPSWSWHAVAPAWRADAPHLKYLHFRIEWLVAQAHKSWVVTNQLQATGAHDLGLLRLPALARATGSMQRTPQQFLRDTPRGAYTTLCVQGGSLLLDWPMHLERLIRSLKALHEAVDGFYDAYYSWLEVGMAPSCRWRPLPCRHACRR